MPRGRPQRPHQCSYGEKKLIPGLYHCPDGRWRINATGERFTESNEQRAVERFLRWEAEQEQKKAAMVPVGSAVYPDEVGRLVGKAGKNKITIRIPKDWRKGVEVSKSMPGTGIWAYFRDMLQNDPDYVEKMIGAPGLAKAAREHVVKKPVRIAQVRESYLKHSHATDKAKQEALAPFDRLIKFGEVVTLDDLTESVLAKWREQIVNHSGLKSSGTISGYFSRVRNVLRLAARGDVDSGQIDTALVRCKARLYPPPNNVADNPNPVTSKDESDFAIGKPLPLYYEIASQEPEDGFLREANGTRGVPLYSVVPATFIGQDAEGLPAFLFNFQVMDPHMPVTPHDHRDNYNGGFSFAVFHPGTGLPQQPWAQ